MKRINGSATITTVLILGTVATIVATFMLITTTDNVIFSKVLREGKQAEYATEACAEVALAKLRQSATYSGNETITIDTYSSCTIDIVIVTGSQYTIKTHSTVGNSTKHLEVVVSSIGQNLNVLSWNFVQN